MKEDLFRQTAENGQTVLMSWHTLGNPIAVEIAGIAGWQAAMIDQQHGMATTKDVIASLTAAQAVGRPVFVRVGRNDPYDIGYILDAGAQGIICPMISNADEAKALVSAVKYPPLGERSFGPYRAKHVHGDDYFEKANQWTIACAQIETEAALENIEDILCVKGLDMILVGPNDLAISLSQGKSRDIRNPELLYALDRILVKAREYEVMAGIFANDEEYAKILIQKGWDVVSVGTDLGHLANGMKQSLSILTALALK